MRFVCVGAIDGTRQNTAMDAYIKMVDSVEVEGRREFRKTAGYPWKEGCGATDGGSSPWPTASTGDSSILPRSLTYPWPIRIDGILG